MLPYLAPLIITPAGGMYADKLITSGKPVGHVRKIMCSITLLGPASAFAVLVAVPQPSPFLATLLSTLAIGCLGCGDSSYWAAYVDISPRFAGKNQRCLRHSGSSDSATALRAGILLGMGNTLGNFAGILVNLVTGSILDSFGIHEDASPWLAATHTATPQEVLEAGAAGWTAVFLVAIVVNVVGAASFACFYSNEGGVIFP